MFRDCALAHNSLLLPNPEVTDVAAFILSIGRIGFAIFIGFFSADGFGNLDSISSL